MRTLSHYLLALLLAAGLVLTGISSDGGENGLGIWILPHANYITSGVGTPTQITQPRDVKTFALNKDVVMDVSSNMGNLVATLVDDVSGQPVALPVCGGRVTIPANLLASIAGLSSPKASLVINDASQLGYVIRLCCDQSAGTVTIKVQ